MSAPTHSSSQATAVAPRRASPYFRAVALSSVAKAVALVLSGGAALVSARTVVDVVGVSGYALVTLVGTLPTFLTLTELGIRAAVLDAFADNDRERIRRTFVSAARALTCAGAAICGCGALTALSGVAASLLESASGPDLALCIALVTALFGCSLPLSLGGAALAGLGRNHVAVLLQSGGTVLALIIVLLAAASKAPPAVFAVSGLIGQCMAGFTSLIVAGRTSGMPLLRTVLWPRRRLLGTRIIHLAGPMAVINATSAVAYGTDRIVLSKLTDATAVAVYSAGAQLYVPASTLVAASALPLWSLFHQRRRDCSMIPRSQLLRLTACFAGGAVLIGAGLVTVGPAVASWMLHGRASVGPGLMAAFGALVLAHALNYPVGMWLSDAAGLRFQAVRAVIMTVVNLIASVALALVIGPAGPVLASAGAYFLCVTLPCYRKVFFPGVDDREYPAPMTGLVTPGRRG